MDAFAEKDYTRPGMGTLDLPGWALWTVLATSVLFVALPVFLLWDKSRASRQRELFEMLGQNFRGEVRLAPDQRLLELSVPVPNTLVRGSFSYSIVPGASPIQYSDFTVPLKGNPLTLKVHSDTFLSRMDEPTGPAPLPSKEEFERVFIVTSNRPDLSSQFLGSRQVQKALAELRELRGNSHISLELGPDLFRMRKLSFLQDYDEAQAFIRNSLFLFDRASQLAGARQA